MGLLGFLLLVANTQPLLAEPPLPTSDAAELLGQKVQALSKLDKTDYSGKQWTWNELAGTQATVIAFLGTECPLAKQYTPRIVELSKK
ncbi:MAG: hypothetical protein WCP62_03020, partial [Planctomycetota bacterium]